jgi:hypothetical protein
MTLIVVFYFSGIMPKDGFLVSVDNSFYISIRIKLIENHNSIRI